MGKNKHGENDRKVHKLASEPPNVKEKCMTLPRAFLQYMVGVRVADGNTQDTTRCHGLELHFLVALAVCIRR